jgi:glycosyltransferase involved in cell wall biosynthesis
MADLDIIIPVYNEKENITGVLNALSRMVRTPFRLLICYDDDDDNTLPVVRGYDAPFEIVLVKNRGKGAHAAVRTGFGNSSSPAVIVLTADDTFNAGIIDRMYGRFADGCDIVAPSRFLKGGCMKNCPLLKAVFARVSSFTLYWLAGIPVHDATNGFRLFSRKVLKEIEIESTEGFTYSIELLVKCHRLGWRIEEVPALWFERTNGKSRFLVMRWLPHYFRWYFYAFQTRYNRFFPEKRGMNG